MRRKYNILGICSFGIALVIFVLTCFCTTISARMASLPPSASWSR